jgi:hypothetical protein
MTTPQINRMIRAGTTLSELNVIRRRHNEQWTFREDVAAFGIEAATKAWQIRTTPKAIGDGWTIINSEHQHSTALACARGCYQRNILNGFEAISGSTLKGKARSYGFHYAESRRNLLARLTNAGIFWNLTRGRRHVLVIGE